MATTVLSLRAANGKEYSVAGPLRIGRATENEICLTGDDLVSRLHARVWPDGDRLFIRDEGSSNGTTVNTQRLTPGETYRLRRGDTLRIGSATFSISERPAERAVTGPLPAPQPVAAPAAPPAPPAATAIAPSPLAPPAAPAAPLAATRTASAPSTPAASHRWRNLLVGGCLVLIVLGLCGGLVALGATAGRPAIATALAQVVGAPTPAPTPVRGTPAATAGPTSANAPTPAATSGAFSVQVLSTQPPATPLAPAGYAANSLAVAAALAELNAAQLQFIHANPAGQPPAPSAGDDLLKIAAASYKLGAAAESLCTASAVQDGASDNAQKVASLYGGLARYGYAQVLDAQDLRAGLASGALDTTAAVARVADYGARAWNPSVTDPAKAGNPFLPFVSASAGLPTATPLSVAGAAALQASLGAQASFQAWIAAPAETLTRTAVVLPPVRPLDNPQDPAVLASLITAAGQADADRASQAAAAGLQRLGATLDPAGRHSAARSADLAAQQAGTRSVHYQAPSALVMTGEAKPGGQALPSFPGGSGAALTKSPPPAAGGDDAFINNVFNLGPDNTPAKTGDTPIRDAAPLVNLTLTNIRIDVVNQRPKTTISTFEADIQYSFDVTWQTNLVHPNFELQCVSNNHQDITTASGTLHLRAVGLLILYPGAEDAYCSADGADGLGGNIGSVSIQFLVGDAAAATQRAAQVETDAMALDLTATADVQNTQAQATQDAAQTQSVLQTQNALETEQAASQTAEFRATITAIAHLTAVAVPVASDTPSPTPTFVPVLLETLEHPGDQFGVTTKTVLQPNRLYQFCFSGTVNLINPDRAAKASDIDHVNGVAVPLSECMVVEGNGKAAAITCGSGEIAQDPGGFTIQVVDLGPG